MAVGFEPSKVRGRLSSLSIDKLLKSKKNFPRTPPRLWLDGQDDPIETDNQGLPILKLSHPILHALESCTNIRQFKHVHTQLVVSGLFQHSLAASRVVKKLCSASVMFPHAVYVFDCLEEPDAFICNTIMRSYVNINDPFGALRFYHERMVGKWIMPNHYTFPLLLKVCVEIGSVIEGKKTHAQVVKLGIEFDLFVRNSLIRMYSVCGRIGDARMMFDTGPELDLVSWNTMIDGYVKNGEVGVARELFDEMYERDIFSWNSMITGYVGTGDMEAAKGLFERMTYRDVVSWNCMIDGYARIGNVLVAREFFDQMPLQNVVSWNTMLALYVRYKHYGECLTLFDRMIDGGDVRPNEATLMSVLTACANLGRLDRGSWVHSYLKLNRIKSDVLLSTALLTMYAKCGAVGLARDVFDEMPNRTVVSWNSMIMGYGMNGNAEKALEMFMHMQKSGPTPNDATFICVLSACTHAGMVFEGWWCFDLMSRVYKIEPKVEHYGCMVDLLARAGLMKDSEELISNLPMESGPVLRGALLSACSTHSNSELGEIVAKRLIELEPGDLGPYVLLSNIYAAEGRWGDVEHVRKMMKENGLQKESGSSQVHLHEFKFESFAEQGSVHRRNMLYSMLSEMGAHVKLSCTDYKMM